MPDVECGDKMKILIIGVGRLGSQVAMLSVVLLKPEKIILYDVKDLEGDILDLRHACTGLGIKTAVTKKPEPCDYIIITAGQARDHRNKVTEKQLYATNASIIRSVVHYAKRAIDKNTTIIVMTNPVMKLTRLVSDMVPGTKVLNPENFLLEMREGKELGMKIVKTKGYTNFGAAVSVVKLINSMNPKHDL